jgi:hypothetical protein
VRIRALQFFFAAISLPLVSIVADEIRPAKFVDVDGNTLSTAEGHITVVVLTTKADLPKAHLVGDRTPDFCLGNPTYRMITLVKFENHGGLVRSLAAAMARRRLDAEAKQLQSRYAAKKIERDARHDIFAVVDVDGTAAAQLPGELPVFAVFVFGKTGELLKQWNDVPEAAELAEALK